MREWRQLESIIIVSAEFYFSASVESVTHFRAAFLKKYGAPRSEWKSTAVRPSTCKRDAKNISSRKKCRSIIVVDSARGEKRGGQGSTRSGFLGNKHSRKLNRFFGNVVNHWAKKRGRLEERFSGECCVLANPVISPVCKFRVTDAWSLMNWT